MFFIYIFPEKNTPYPKNMFRAHNDVIQMKVYNWEFVMLHKGFNSQIF
jgi:hypothetical protein